MKVVVVIPARLAATRLPDKPLADLMGKPIVQWVYEAGTASGRADEVIVATDSQRLVDVVEGFGGKAALTSSDHITGTDRIAEVAAGLDCDLVCNLQGDEPFLSRTVVDELVAPFEKYPDLLMSTLCRVPTGKEEVMDPNKVKVVRDLAGFALYFSRWPIPYVRDGEIMDVPHFIHLGVYAYKRDFLLGMAKLPPTTLQLSESLEQLKVMENGHRIFVGDTDHISLGIDTPADLEAARELAAELLKKK